jgi:predicted amidohydrolase
MNVGLFQYDPIWEDRAASREKISSILALRDESVFPDWLIFPEMTLTGFSNDSGKTTLDDFDLEFFRNLAVVHRTAVTFGGAVAEKNLSITIGSDGIELARYEKNHLFASAQEDKHYRPGSELCEFEIGDVRIRPVVCYDLRFPYLFWERAAEVDLYVVIANWPEARSRHWRSLLTARAIENQAYVVGVNRVGSDPQSQYSGDSRVIDPTGEVQLECGNREGIFVSSVSVERVRDIRRRMPFLKDRLR